MHSIIIADDEVIERKVLEHQLRKYYGEDCDIRAAANGREAVALFSERSAQVLVLDIQMPGMTGLEAAMEVRRKDPLCSIIFLTAFDEFAYAKKAIAVRATDYLLKPCDFTELISAVEEGFVQAKEHEQTYGKKAGQADDAFETMHPEEVQPEDGKEDRRDEYIRQIRRYIDLHYTEELSITQMAAMLGYAEPYFCKLFKQYFGKSFVSYLTEYRIQKAVRLMEDPSRTVSAIGSLVGYQDANYFAKVFKRIMQISPTEYRVKKLPVEN